MTAYQYPDHERAKDEKALAARAADFREVAEICGFGASPEDIEFAAPYVAEAYQYANDVLLDATQELTGPQHQCMMVGAVVTYLEFQADDEFKCSTQSTEAVQLAIQYAYASERAELPAEAYELARIHARLRLKEREAAEAAQDAIWAAQYARQNRKPGA